MNAVENAKPEDHAGAMKARMRSDMVEAIKAKRPEDTAILRILLAAIDNAEAPPLESAVPPRSGEVARLALTGREVEAILLEEAAGCEQAAAKLALLGQRERADILRRQAVLARRYIERIGR